MKRYTAQFDQLANAFDLTRELCVYPSSRVFISQDPSLAIVVPSACFVIPDLYFNNAYRFYYSLLLIIPVFRLYMYQVE